MAQKNENPFAQSTLTQKIFTESNISQKIRTGLTGKKKPYDPYHLPSGSVSSWLVGMNNAVDIVAQACSCCWDKPVPADYDDRATYIAKRSKTGHTSIIEHSNFVVYLSVDNGYTDELLNVVSSTHYLYWRIIRRHDGSGWNCLVGGSLRGYTDILKEIDDFSNPILNALVGQLYSFSNSAFFEDICNAGVLDKERFRNANPNLDPDNYKMLTANPERIEFDLFDIVGIDNIERLYSNIYQLNEEFARDLTIFDLLKFATVTVMFKNMSRTCTHQLVRHRNAITQESQRYVDYSKAAFNSPAKFKPAKYDADHWYSVRFGPSAPLTMKLEQIGQAMCDIYGQLNNPTITGDEYALVKEDARAFLPSNVQCKRIYMTYTFKSLIKFLELREHSAAQAEIRMYATAFGEWFRSNAPIGYGLDSKEVSDKLSNTTRNNLWECFEGYDEEKSEPITDTENTEDIQVTDDDYVKFNNLDKTDDNEVPIQNPKVKDGSNV